MSREKGESKNLLLLYPRAFSQARWDLRFCSDLRAVLVFQAHSTHLVPPYRGQEVLNITPRNIQRQSDNGNKVVASSQSNQSPCSNSMKVISRALAFVLPGFSASTAACFAEHMMYKGQGETPAGG